MQPTGSIVSIFVDYTGCPRS